MKFRAICPQCDKHLLVSVDDVVVECPWCHTLYCRRIVRARPNGTVEALDDVPEGVAVASAVAVTIKPPRGEKPPPGVEPYPYWRERVEETGGPDLTQLLARYLDVAAAVTRYRNANRIVPEAWLVELGVI